MLPSVPSKGRCALAPARSSLGRSESPPSPRLWRTGPFPAHFSLRSALPAKGCFAHTRAFSLVEVVLAIGLATFALLVIFSLLPAGLKSLQEANRQIVETEIFNSLGAELASTKFDDVEAHLASRFTPSLYFDNEGLQVDSADKASFFVIGEAYGAEGAGELRRVTVSIGFQREPARFTAARTPHTTRRTFLLVDRGL